MSDKKNVTTIDSSINGKESSYKHSIVKTVVEGSHVKSYLLEDGVPYKVSDGKPLIPILSKEDYQNH